MAVIILRLDRDSGLDPYRVQAGAASPTVKDLKLDVAEPTRRELADLRRDPSVLNLAAPMPVSLIKPMAARADTTTEGAEMAWGVRAVGAENCSYSGAGVTVAVLDTGIQKDHTAFPPDQIKIVTKNFVGGPAGDTVGHGTHCAGTIFGRPVGGCRIGVAPGVKKALIGKVLGKSGGSTDAVFKAILWAYQNGAHVISMSLAIDFPGYQQRLVWAGHPPAVATSLALEGFLANMRLFDRLSGLTNFPGGPVQGAVIVAAAGNESQREVDPFYRIATAPPAAAEGFLSVAAVQPSGKKSRPYAIAPFSNAGARVAAPGVNIPSARLGGGLVCCSGTSMATPHVAGVSALWAEKLMRENLRFRPDEVITKLENAAIRTPGLDEGDVGAGLVQAPR
jgi:subtilisin family serine protease